VLFPSAFHEQTLGSEKLKIKKVKGKGQKFAALYEAGDSEKSLDSGCDSPVAKFQSSKVAHYTGKISPKSKVQCPKSKASLPTLDFGHWTLDY
jgi:hypothetical protein